MSTITFKQNTTTRLKTTRSYDNVNRLMVQYSTVNGLEYPQHQFMHQYTYNQANQRTRVTLANKTYWDYGYDALGQVTSGKHRWADSSLVGAQQFEYGFDEIGNRVSTKAGGSATGTGLRSASYTPYRLNEYSQRTVPGAIDVLGAAAANATVTVEGQTADRRAAYFWKETPLNNASAAVWEQINVVSGANQDNRYAFLPKTPEQFTHDVDGNLTQDGRWDYTWDAENRVVKMVSRSGAPSGSERWMEFEYDWKGRRIGKKVWNNTTGTGTAALEQKFVYDGWNLLAILNPQSSIIQSFTWGLDLSGSEQGAGGVGGLLMVNDASTINSQPSTHFPTYDGNGNLVALVYAADDATTTTVNEAGMVSASYDYGPFGEVIRMTGAMAGANPFRFSTKYQDDESDQLYYGYRSYNPSTGRWLNRDPIGERGGLNLYEFAWNNPVDYFDHFGLFVKPTDYPPADPNDNTIICDNGKLTIQNKNKGPDRKCTGVHEYTHLQDWLKRYGDDVCKGQKNGTTPVGGDGYDEFLRQSECKAFKAGKKCREDLLKNCKEKDRDAIQRGIDRDNEQLKKHKCD